MSHSTPTTSTRSETPGARGTSEASTAPAIPSMPSPERAAAFWPSTRLIARRELVERARDKSFLLSSGLTLAIVVLAIVVPPLLGLGDPSTYRVAFTGERADALAGAVQTRAETLGVEVERVEVGAEVSIDGGQAGLLLAENELDALVGDGTVRVQESLDGALEATLQDAYTEIVSAEQLADSGLDPAAVGEALTVAPLEVEAVDPPDPGAGTRQTIAFFAVILLYGQLIGYGMWVANGVVEEKSSRVVELLLAAVRPRALMAGKILGIGVLGLAQLLVIAAVGVGIGAATGVLTLGTDVLVPVAAVLAWFVLGFGFYAAFFAAAASRVSRQEELQNVITPAIMLMLVSFFTAFYAVNAEDNPVVQALSVLPPFSALVNPVRIAAGDAALWEVGASLVLMVAAISALVLVAARLYENGVLRMGSTMSWREAWRRNG